MPTRHLHARRLVALLLGACLAWATVSLDAPAHASSHHKSAKAHHKHAKKHRAAAHQASHATKHASSSSSSSQQNCTPGYSPCLPPASDYDCAGGSGNGPEYAYGPIYVTGSDPYGLDSDGDGVGCE